MGSGSWLVLQNLLYFVIQLGAVKDVERFIGMKILTFTPFKGWIWVLETSFEIIFQKSFFVRKNIS